MISGTGAFGYSGTTDQSIYEINGANTYAGDTYINTGQVGIASDAAFGNGGVIQLNGGNGGNNVGIDLRADWTTSKSIHVRNSASIDTNGFTATFNGPIIGSAGLTKNNNGALVLTAANPSTGQITINAGDVRLVNGGALAVQPSLGFGTRLILDDTGTHYSDRLPDTGTLSGNNTDVQLLGNSAVTTEEVIGSLTLGSASKVTVAAGAGQSAILRLGAGATFTRSTGSSILFRGTNLGTAVPGTPNVSNIMIFNPLGSAAALTGGAGPGGTTAISIIAGAFGDTNPNGNGTQLVTYDLNNGIRLLNPATEYATGLNKGTVMSDNVHVVSTTAGVNNTTAVNALWVDGTAGPVSITGTGTLTLSAGNILVSGTGNTLGVGSIVGGTVANAIAVGGPGDLNITANITSANTGGLIKTGDGNLTLSGTNAYTGTTYLSSGTLTVNSASAIPAALRVLGGTLAAGQAGLTVSGAVGLDGDLTFGGSNGLTLSGTVSLDSGYRTISVNGAGADPERHAPGQ